MKLPHRRGWIKYVTVASTDRMTQQTTISFDTFGRWTKRREANPIIETRAEEEIDWAAAAHYIVDSGIVHYLWGAKDASADVQGGYWQLMHSKAPVADPTDVTQDPTNPVLSPSDFSFDDTRTEYPSPFRNPLDGNIYAYYLGENEAGIEQTGMLARSDETYSSWTRMQPEPVIRAENSYDDHGAAHASAVVVGDETHLLYTARATGSTTDCTLAHATAPLSDLTAVQKDPTNPVFSGLEEWWDEAGVREGELYAGPEYFHILYGGSDGETWRCGHVRTKDFDEFEPNPYNPILTGTKGDFDEHGTLTPCVGTINGTYWMLYAGNDAGETRGTDYWGDDRWQTGWAVISPDDGNAHK